MLPTAGRIRFYTRVSTDPLRVNAEPRHAAEMLLACKSGHAHCRSIACTTLYAFHVAHFFWGRTVQPFTVASWIRCSINVREIHVRCHALFPPGRNSTVQFNCSQTALGTLGIPLICQGFRRHKLVDQNRRSLFAGPCRRILARSRSLIARCKDELAAGHSPNHLELTAFCECQIGELALCLCPFRATCSPKGHNRLALSANGGQQILKPFRRRR